MIIISPYSVKLPNGKENPKNYPWWPDVISLLKQENFEDITQIGIRGETALDVDRLLLNLPLAELKLLIDQSLTWASVDNFCPHFARWYCGKPGVVIYGQSDPDIFGYPQNINLLKDKKYLKPRQFGKWTDVTFDANCFVDPKAVINAIKALA